jgi:hypothetical protein
MELGVAAHGSRAELDRDSGKWRAARYNRSGGLGGAAVGNMEQGQAPWGAGWLHGGMRSRRGHQGAKRSRVGELREGRAALLGVLPRSDHD